MDKRTKNVIISGLWLNIFVGLIHTMAHFLEERVILTPVDIVLPLTTQIAIPLVISYLLIVKDKNTDFLLLTVLFMNFLIIFSYSTYYHFIADTIDNISHSSAGITGLMFTSTSMLLLILQLGLLLLIPILILNERASISVVNGS